MILSAQAALRNAIGEHDLGQLLSQRERLGSEILSVLDEKTNAWGITTQAVEIRDIVIPKGLEDAMSRQAQAEAVVVGYRAGVVAGVVVLAVGVVGQVLYVRWFPSISRSMGYGSVADTPAAAVPARGPLPDVTLYTANVCPFCPIIRRRLADLQRQSRFEVREIDVTFRPEIAGPRDCGAFRSSRPVANYSSAMSRRRRSRHSWRPLAKPATLALHLTPTGGIMSRRG